MEKQSEFKKYAIILTEQSHSELIQKLLFENGFNWGVGTSGINTSRIAVIIIDDYIKSGSLGYYSSYFAPKYSDKHELYLSNFILSNPSIVSTFDGAKEVEKKPEFKVAEPTQYRLAKDLGCFKAGEITLQYDKKGEYWGMYKHCVNGYSTRIEINNTDIQSFIDTNSIEKVPQLRSWSEIDDIEDVVEQALKYAATHGSMRYKDIINYVKQQEHIR
jgi:hypothetical protein